MKITSADVLGTLQPIWHTLGGYGASSSARTSPAAGSAPCSASRGRSSGTSGRCRTPRWRRRSRRSGPRRHGPSRSWGSRPWCSPPRDRARRAAVRWSDMDLDAAVWTIPGERMKALREHRVPLSRRAVQVLGAARTLGVGDCPLVFPTAQGRPLTDMPLSRPLILHRRGRCDGAGRYRRRPHTFLSRALGFVMAFPIARSAIDRPYRS